MLRVASLSKLMITMLDGVPAQWSRIPATANGMTLRALKRRGLVETRFEAGWAEWRQRRRTSAELQERNLLRHIQEAEGREIEQKSGFNPHRLARDTVAAMLRDQRRRRGSKP